MYPGLQSGYMVSTLMHKKMPLFCLRSADVLLAHGEKSPNLLYNADCFLPVLRSIKLTEVFELFEMS